MNLHEFVCVFVINFLPRVPFVIPLITFLNFCDRILPYLNPDGIGSSRFIFLFTIPLFIQQVLFGLLTYPPSIHPIGVYLLFFINLTSFVLTFLIYL